jgi:hypothetical protein
LHLASTIEKFNKKRLTRRITLLWKAIFITLYINGYSIN